MKRIKHSKLKNTGFLFEILVRQVTADILENNAHSKAMDIIRKFFRGGTSLAKELGFYQAILNEKFNSEDKAKEYIEAVVEERSQMNNTSLRREKYNLIKEIKESGYNIDEMFRSKIENYKEIASVYKMFEAAAGTGKLLPQEKIRCKYALIEHITRNTKKTLQESKKETQEEKDLRVLSYKIMVEKFNTKYTNLDKNQKTLLREYINNISNTNHLREFVNMEVDKVKKKIEFYIPKVDDQITRIKLKEVVNVADKIKKGRVIREDQLVSLMRFYELLKELKNETK